MIFALVAVLQVPAVFLAVDVSPILSILANEFLVFLLMPIAVIVIAGRSPRTLLPFPRPPGATLLVSVAIALGLAVLLSYAKYASEAFMPIPDALLLRQTQAVGVHSWHDFFLKLALLGVLAPVCEEIFFRGILQTALARRIGAGRAVVVAAVLFALVHSTSFYPQILLLLGLALSYLYRATGTLRVPIVCHAVYNCFVLANQIRGVAIPLRVPPGLEDLALAASAVVVVAAGLFWLRLKGMPAEPS